MDEITQLKLRINVLTEIVQELYTDKITLHNFKKLSKFLPIDNDIEIKCKDGVVHANKAILCAKSDAFNTMLNGSYKESSEGVSFPENNCEEVSMLVNFMTYGRLPKDNISGEWYDTTNEVIILAQAYGQDKLGKTLLGHRANSLFLPGTWFLKKYDTKVYLWIPMDRCRNAPIILPGVHEIEFTYYVDTDDTVETYTWYYEYKCISDIGEPYTKRGIYLTAVYDSKWDNSRDTILHRMFEKEMLAALNQHESELVPALNGT